MKKIIMSILMIVLALSATNGMNVIGIGAQSSSLGGTTQILDNPQILASNPAIIGFAKSTIISLDCGLMFPTVNFENSLNDKDADSQIFPLPSFSYIHKIEGSQLGLGFSAFAQGGMGATYELKHQLFYSIDPATGQVDYNTLLDQDYHSQIAYMKFNPAISWNFTEQFSIGLSPSFGYAMLEMKMPYSIDPSKMKGDVPGTNGSVTFGDMFGNAPDDEVMPGLGYKEVTAIADMEDGVTGFGFGASIGMNYKVSNKLMFGFTYTSQSDITFEGDASMDMTQQFNDAFGKMVMGALVQMGIDPNNATNEEMQMAHQAVMTNLTNMGVDMTKGMVADYDAEVEMAWPQQFDFSLQYKPMMNTTVFANFKWLDWESAMDKFTMTMTKGSNDNINLLMGSDEVKLQMPLEWKSQFVFGLGVEQKFNEMFSGRVGYNYGNNPIPKETLIPIFPAIVEHHITLGAGINITENLGLDFSYEYVIENEEEVNKSDIATEYNDSESSLGENLLFFGLNYKF
ncbi:MAG: outer membrane protein transport protein [Candidatus Delongbacteria bacterium]|nr:outer membrane protein transport protein [Candidatus Delongbacteria bacterium]MBN2836659.1 outer membrane protein transport protein [Candidatus Delongbacteria bacterium]